MKLGVLKMVADKIPALLHAVCGQWDARRGPKAETLVAANERIAHMGRLILATLAPPGYVQRHASIPSIFVRRGRRQIWRRAASCAADNLMELE